MGTSGADSQGHASGLDAGRSVLVTGGAGFIGSHLVRLLLDEGSSVTVVDNLSTGRRDNLPPSHDRLRFIEADVTTGIDALADETFDEVIHLAAAVGVRLIVEQPIHTIETNVIETSTLLRFALTCGRDGTPANVLVASSSEVYGKSDRVPFREDDDVLYGPTTKSRWSYAHTKALDEHLALAHHQQNRLPVVVARLFNTVGPRQVGDYGMVVPSFVRRAMSGQPLLVYGDGEQARCFCDVRDVAPALLALTRTPSCHGRVFNVGSDRPITIRSLAERVIETLGSSSPIKTVPYDEAYAPGFEDLRLRQPDLSRIREAIGFAPTIPLDETIRGVRDAIAQREGAGA